MGYEEIVVGHYPCPCGKGEYKEYYTEHDLYPSRSRRTTGRMLCRECSERYEWDWFKHGWALKREPKNESQAESE